MVLPAGFEVPPLPHLVGLLVVTAAVVGLLGRRRPAVTERLVVAFVPWIVLGSTLHVIEQVGSAPRAAAPLFGAPAVYLTTFAAAGAVWLLADGHDRVPAVLAGVGTLCSLVAIGALFAEATAVHPAWSLVSLVVGLGLGAVSWAILDRLRPEVAVTGWVGMLVLHGHALDGVSTAVGVDVLGFGERTPVSRLIMDLAGALPTADLVGVGWLFVLVKLAVAAIVVSLFTGYVREDPQEGYLLLGAIAAVGLGPGTHNLLLYAVG